MPQPLCQQICRLSYRLLSNRETQDVIKVGIGMLSVLAFLVLGLLIATARTSYDSTDRAIRSYAAELALLMRSFETTAATHRSPTICCALTL